MYNIVKKTINDYQKQGRKTFNIKDIEDIIIKNIGGYTEYHIRGGYENFYNAIIKIKKEGLIDEMKTVGFNNTKPSLKLKWNIIYKDTLNKWSNKQILKLSDLLDMSKYIKNPRLQTDKELEYIEVIYNFIKHRDSREWATLEERSLELFKDEKYLKAGNKGNNHEIEKGILKRLNLSLEDLKIKKYGEMFVYWNRGVKEVKNVAIVENYSTFYSYKRTVEENRRIFGFFPDIIIFGGGKKIIKSLSFIEEIASNDDVKIKYFGDIDPEGLMIYDSIKNKYMNLDINLDIAAYRELINYYEYKQPCYNQRKNKKALSNVLEEIRNTGEDELADKILKLWELDFRLPQEYITYEYIKKYAGDING